jgi:hypothetical protein
VATLSELITRVSNRCNKTASTGSEAKTRITNWINLVCQEQWESYEWSFRTREYPIVLTAGTTSGTVTVANGSQTVTASGTPFLSTVHKGAFIRFTADAVNQWYRVQNVVSTSVLTIEPPYQGSQTSGAMYELKRVDYILPADIQEIRAITYGTLNNCPIILVSGLELMDLRIGTPDVAYLSTPDFRGSSYTCTLSASINSHTVTGSGSAFLTNVQPGDTLTDGVYTYVVYSVDTDTSLTLVNYTRAAIVSGSYTFTRELSRTLRIVPSSDDEYVVYVRGLRKYAPLVNDLDKNEMTGRFPMAIVESAVRLELASSPDSREGQAFQISEELWRKARAEDQTLSPRIPIRVWSDRRRYGSSPRSQMGL